MTVERAAVIAEALTWVGTHYHHHARIKGVGVDCGMLLLEVYATVGLIPQVDPGYYPQDWHLHRGEERYLRFVTEYCDLLQEPPLPGDVAVFRIGRCISHGAIVLNWPLVIHSHVRQNCRVADATEAELYGHKVVFYRPRGLV